MLYLSIVKDACLKKKNPNKTIPNPDNPNQNTCTTDLDAFSFEWYWYKAGVKESAGESEPCL